MVHTLVVNSASVLYGLAATSNEKTIDPVEFASQQRELSRATTVHKALPPQTFLFGEKGSRNGGLYIQRSGNTRVRVNVVVEYNVLAFRVGCVMAWR